MLQLRQRNALTCMASVALPSVLWTWTSVASPEDAARDDGSGRAVKAIVSEAVGRLHIPAIRYENGYPRHYDEQCSATLVALEAGEASPYLLSAWHCLADYRDLSRPLIYTDTRGTDHAVTVISTGGSMDRDWALLRIPVALPGALPLAEENWDSSIAQSAVLLAGFPRARQDATLTFRSGCSVIGTDGDDRRTDCVLQRGASGGAALNGSWPPTVIGVISRGDGVTQSIYVPLARFLRTVRSHLLGDS